MVRTSAEALAARARARLPLSLSAAPAQVKTHDHPATGLAARGAQLATKARVASSCARFAYRGGKCRSYAMRFTSRNLRRANGGPRCVKACMYATACQLLARTSKPSEAGGTRWCAWAGTPGADGRRGREREDGRHGAGCAWRFLQSFVITLEPAAIPSADIPRHGPKDKWSGGSQGGLSGVVLRLTVRPALLARGGTSAGGPPSRPGATHHRQASKRNPRDPPTQRS